MSSNKVFRALISDPQPLIRAGIKAVINDSEDASVAAEVPDVRHLILRARRYEGNAVVLSSDAIGQIQSAEFRQLTLACQEYQWPIILLLDPSDTKIFADGIKAGIRGFVNKSSAAEDLVESLHITAQGRAYVSAALMTPFITWLSGVLPETSLEESIDVSVLSSREEEVLELLGHGLSNVQIAKQLGIKESTVRSHTYHIITKLSLQTRIEAVIVGLRRAEERRYRPSSAFALANCTSGNGASRIAPA